VAKFVAAEDLLGQKGIVGNRGLTVSEIEPASISTLVSESPASSINGTNNTHTILTYPSTASYSKTEMIGLAKWSQNLV
jgi:hypothetical protein